MIIGWLDLHFIGIHQEKKIEEKQEFSHKIS